VEPMKISTKFVCLVLVFSFALSGWMNAAAENPKDIQKSCRKFVQEFYNWYLPRREKGNAQDANSVLKQRQANSKK
jgi:hypothetical protein